MAASDWRPDPAKGVFETLLVVDGKPVELGGHLARLGRSLAEVYGAELAAETGPRAVEAARSLALGRLRVTAVPSDGGIELDLTTRAVDPAVMFPAEGAALRWVERPGGHGPHKWVDRRGMEHPAGEPGQLICDGEELLEAGWANLFAIRGSTIRTPLADGRILAGTARAAILEIATAEGLKADEGPLTHGDLLEADEVFLTNSVRGVEPAIELDGAPLAGCGPISHRLAAALRQRWGLPRDPDALQVSAGAPKADQLSH